MRRRLSRDNGTTIIELSIVVSLLGIVVAAILSVLNATQSNLEREVSRTTSNDQLRLAVESIDREVRSGNVLYDPSTESFSPGDVAPGMSLRIYTQSNEGTRGNQAWCVQWRITSSGQLQQRRWLPTWTDSSNPSQVTGWRIVASTMTNRSEGIAAFSRAGSAANVLSVRLRENDEAAKGSTVEVQDDLAGRNTEFFPATTNCGPSTPDPSQQNTKDGTKVPPY